MLQALQERHLALQKSVNDRRWRAHILTASPPEIPEVLVDELKRTGILVAPVREENSESRRDGENRWWNNNSFCYASELRADDNNVIESLPIMFDIRQRKVVTSTGCRSIGQVDNLRIANHPDTMGYSHPANLEFPQSLMVDAD